jgi:hypothetical protein
VWGVTTYRPPGRLGYRPEGERGALLVNYLAGPTSVPADLEAAGVVAVVQLNLEQR